MIHGTPIKNRRALKVTDQLVLSSVRPPNVLVELKANDRSHRSVTASLCSIKTLVWTNLDEVNVR